MKTFTQLAVIAAILTLTPPAVAQDASDEPVYSWGNLYDGGTAAGDQASAIAFGSADEIYWANTGGTTDSSMDVNYAGELLFTGSPYNAGTSYANNFSLLKTDASGEKQWVVYTNSGDFASGSISLAVTSDGGVVFTTKVRHTDGHTDSDINFVDANGNSVGLGWTCDRRWYQLVVGKVSKDGEIEWLRLVDVSTTPTPAATSDFLADSFSVNCVAVDSNDNIYLGINYRNLMSFPMTNGTKVSFYPHNITDWSGDSQKTVGDMLLVKLNAEGYYLNALSTTGSAVAETVQNLEWKDGYLYFYGYILGSAGQKVAIDGTEFSPTDSYNPFVGRCGADMKIDWARCFEGEKVDGKNAVQNVGMTVGENYLWLCGQYNLKITDSETGKSVASSQGSIREGFVIKLDKTDGSWVAARDSRDDEWANPSALAKTGLTGYLKVLENPDNDGEVYVFGYVMNAAVGVFLRAYDSTTLEANFDHTWNLVTNGGAPSCQNILYDPERSRAYLTARGNKAFTPYGGSDSSAPSAWAVYMVRFDLPEDLFKYTPEEPLPPEPPVPDDPEFYLRGEFNSWGTPESAKFVKQSDDSSVYTLTVESLSGEFKVADAEWGELYGINYGASGSAVELGVPYLMTAGSNDNLTLACVSAVDVTVTVDIETGELTIDGTAGITGVEVDSTEPVRWFDLQGREVTDPSVGVYIRVQGPSATKVLVK